MAVLVNSGRAAIAAAVKSGTIHLAWGSGDNAWGTTPPAEPLDSTELVSEIGRRVVTESQFCTPDVAGEIVVPPGRFTASLVPTKYLYLRFQFDFEDAPSAIIRELAVFVATVAKNSVPPGQQYLTPSELLDAGTMLTLEHIYLVRSSSIRQRFEFVIEF